MRRKNPWTDIPAEDYEGHMNLPEVDQLSQLRAIFKTALDKYRPKRIAILGCATGNGIEEIDFSRTEKLYALDINSDYLAILKERHSRDLSKIETIACNLDADDLELADIDLIFAALIFEYVDTGVLIGKISKWLNPGGALEAVLQLPCEDIPEISPSPYKSLEKLSTFMKLVPPEKIKMLALERGLKMLESEKVVLKSGKEFCCMGFKKKS